MNKAFLSADPAPDYAAIKQRQQATWGSGDYAQIGTTLQVVGEQLCESLDLAAGSRVLDVAAGNGNATLAAARRFGVVTSTDYVASLLDRGRERASAEHLPVMFETADAEALPYADASFDHVVSTFGVMFTPNQQQAADELWRVCRPGGSIGLANWTPSSFIGQLFKLLGQHLPPLAGLRSPALWGDRAHVEMLFAGRMARIEMTERQFVFRYRSAQHFADVFRAYYGPVHKALASLDTAGQAALEAAFVALLDRHNRATDGTLKIDSAYAEVIIHKA